jgi:acetyl-CoA acetyltransferase
MREAVIVSTARTGIGRAFRGAVNHTKSPTLAGHAIAHAVGRAGVDGAEIEDVVLGSVLSAGTAGMNVARNAAIAAGLPASVAGQTIDRQCASSLMAIATAAKQVMVDGMDVVVAGGQEHRREEPAEQTQDGDDLRLQSHREHEGRARDHQSSRVQAALASKQAAVAWAQTPLHAGLMAGVLIDDVDPEAVIDYAVATIADARIDNPGSVLVELLSRVTSLCRLWVGIEDEPAAATASSPSVPAQL